MTLSELNVKLTANVARFKRQMQSAEQAVGNVANGMKAFGRNMTMFVTGPIAAAAAGAVATAARFERLEKGLASIMGSTTKATVELEKLRDVAKSPGLEFEQAIKGSSRLQAVGLDAESARKALSNMGNALALAGGTAADLDGVTLALTQIISKGTVSAEEINQLAERIPQVRKAMQDAFGTADTEAIQKAGIEGKEFVNGLVQELGKLPKAQQTVSNRFNNLRQKLTELAVTFGNVLLPPVSKLVDVLSRVGKTINNLNPRIKQFVVIAAGVAAALGPLSFTIGSLVSGFIALKGALVTVGTVIAGLSAPVIGTVAAIAAIAGIAGFIIDNWTLVKLQFERIVVSIQKLWAKTMRLIGRKFVSFIKGVIKKVSDVKEFFGGDPIELELELRGDADQKVKDLEARLASIKERIAEEDVEFDFGLDELIQKAKELLGLAQAQLGGTGGDFETRALGDQAPGIGQKSARRVDTLDGGVRSIDQLSADVTPGGMNGEKYNQAIEKQKELNHQTRYGVQLANQFGQSFGSALAQIVVEGESMGEALTRVFKQVIKQLIAAIAKAAILTVVMSSIPGFGGASFGKTFGTLLGGGGISDLAKLPGNTGGADLRVSSRRQRVQLEAVKVSDGIIFQSNQNARQNRNRRVYS